MAETVTASDIDAYIHDAAWAIRSTYHTVLKASPGPQYLDGICYLTYRT